LIRYRIAVVDDFRNEFSFVEYKQYPRDMRIWDACKVSGPREYQKATDCITVFLNYKEVGKFKTREDALNLIRRLLEEAPVNLDEFKDYLLQ
jgi:hypothetical protein